MSKQLSRLAEKLPDANESASQHRRLSRTAFDLVHLARQSGGDRERESELIWLFERQAALAPQRMRDLDARDLGSAATVARLLAAAARTAGAFGVAAACEGYLALAETGAGAAYRGRALDIVEEELAIARSTASDLLAR